MANATIKLVTPCLGRANVSGFGPSMRFGRGSTLACGPCVGGNTAIGGCAVVTGALGTAIGAKTSAYDRGTALGAGAYAAEGSLAVGEGAKACHTQELVLLAGQYDDDTSLGRCGNMIKLHNNGSVTFMLEGCVTCVSKNQFQNVLRGGASFGSAGNVVIGQCVEGSTRFKGQVIIGSYISTGSSPDTCAVTIVGAMTYMDQTAHRATVIGAGSTAGSTDHDAIIIQSGAPFCTDPVNQIKIGSDGGLSLRLGCRPAETFCAVRVLNAFRGGGRATWYSPDSSAYLQCIRMCSASPDATTVKINGTPVVGLDVSQGVVRVGGSSLAVSSCGGATWHPSSGSCVSLQCIRMCSASPDATTVKINGTPVVELNGSSRVIKVGETVLEVSSCGRVIWQSSSCSCAVSLHCIRMCSASSNSAIVRINGTPVVGLDVSQGVVRVGGLSLAVSSSGGHSSAPSWTTVDTCCGSSSATSLTCVRLCTSPSGVDFSVNGTSVVHLVTFANAPALSVGGTRIQLSCLFNASICTTGTHTNVGTGSCAYPCFGTAVGAYALAHELETAIGDHARGTSGYSTVIGAGAYASEAHTVLIQSGSDGTSPRNMLQIHCDGSLTFRLGCVCRTISANDFFTKLGLI